MTYAYNTFDAWLRGHGFDSSLDATGELRDGTAQGFFASQYSAWLTDLLAFYAGDIRARYELPPDQQFSITLNQNDPTGLPIISGLTAAQTAELFGDTSDFAWDGKHVRYYANSFLPPPPPDHAPVADNVTASGTEDAHAITVTLTATDSDAGDLVENFTLTSVPLNSEGTLYTDAALLHVAVAGVAYAASGGTLTLYFAPTENFNGEIKLNYTASDGELSSVAATATITLSQQNDPAEFTGDLAGSVDEDSGPIIGTLLVSDDADGMTAPNFRIENGDGPGNGTASIDPSGHWSYTPNGNFSGSDHFTVSVTDDDGNVETQLVDITVNSINKFSVSTPVDSDLADDKVDENVAFGTAVGVTAFASDNDTTNNGVTYSLSDDAGGLFAINPNTGVVTTAAAIDRETLGPSIKIEVTATSEDGSAAAQTFMIEINGLNDNSPVITSNGGGASASITVEENTTAVTTVIAADADLPSQALSYRIVGGADAAMFTINVSTGVLSFRSAPNFESPTDAGADNVYDVVVRAFDGPSFDNQTMFDEQAIAVTVVKPEGAPIAHNDVWVFTSNADFTALGDFFLTNNDSDPDGDAIVVTAVTENIPWLTPTFSGGVLTEFNIANPTISGTFTLTYTLSDGSLTDTATATIKVVGTGPGPDTITAADLDGSDFTFIDGQGGNDSITGDLFLNGNAGFDNFFGGNGNDTLNGGPGDDVLVDVLGDNVINGGDGNDTLAGGSGNDTLIGGLGSDQLLGYLGNDALIGGFGDDTYNFASSGDGNDTINETGGDGTDIILINTTDTGAALTALNFERVDADGDAAADDLRITFNDQTIDVINQYTSGAVEHFGTFGDATAFGYSLKFQYTLSTNTSAASFNGNVIIASAGTAETLNGGNNDDLLFGNGGGDNMIGGLGSDLLVGGAGADTMDGGSGKDWLVGGTGGDSLTGGSDSDTFVYTALSDSQPNTGDFDTIIGFSANTNTAINFQGVHTNINGDIIDLTAIDAVPGGANQGFSFIGTSNFSDVGQLRYFTQGGEAIIQGNTDTDTATVEFEIHLVGVMTLTQDGFNL